MMRTTLMIAASLALATPALAQQSGPGSTTPGAAQNQQRGQMPSTQSQGGQGAQGTSSASQAMTQTKLRESLQKAGFRNVQIVDATYLVQAQTEDGQSVMMVINPPSMQGRAMSPGGASAGSSGSGIGSGTTSPSTNR